MGFFDKIKDALKRIKEDNKYFARTTARINSNRLYGWVNYKTCKIDPNDDFRAGSYVNIEDGKGLIYNTGDEDYCFSGVDIASFSFVGKGQPINQNNMKVPTLRFTIGFKDGKKTNMDIIHDKVDTFKATFGLDF